MTSNQIAYWNLQESKRHNIETEGINKESNTISKDKNQVEREKLKETNRHNQATESITNKRVDNQNATDIANATFNGIASIGKIINPFNKLFAGGKS